MLLTSVADVVRDVAKLVPPEHLAFLIVVVLIIVAPVYVTISGMRFFGRYLASRLNNGSLAPTDKKILCELKAIRKSGERQETYLVEQGKLLVAHHEQATKFITEAINASKERS